MTFFAMLRRYWWFVLFLILLGVASTWFFTVRQPKVYRAAVSSVIVPSYKLNEEQDVLDGLNTLDRRSVVATLSRIASSEAVRQRTANKLKWSLGEAARYSLRSVVMPDTNVLQISSEGPEAQKAALFANTASEEARRYVRKYYGTYTLQLLDSAVPRNVPVRPNLARNLSVSVLLSLVAASVLLLIWQSWRARREQVRVEI